MVFITGGAFQGKLDYAYERFGLNKNEVYECTDDTEPNLDKRCITHLERYVYYCDTSPENRFRDDAVLIGDDIFCGVVPIDVTERAWREESGRFYGRISTEADEVWRIFCGLPMKLK